MSDEAASNPRAAMIRIEPKTASRYGGQRRHDLRIGHQPDYVDASRVHLNRTLVEPLRPAQLRSICEERRSQRETKRAMRSDSSVAMVGLIGFGTEAQELFLALTIEQQNAALREAVERCAARMRTTVAGLVFHGDETAPHAHAVFVGYDFDGQPLTNTVKRSALRGLQDDVAEVMGRYAPGIERGRSRMDRLAAGADYAETVHRSVRELHRDLPAEIEAKRKAVAELAEAEGAARGRVDEMQKRVDDLHARESLSDKQVKNLAIYERRLTERLEKLRKAQAAAEEARAEADRLAEIARTEAQEETARAGRVMEKARAMVNASVALADEIAAGTVRMTDAGKIQAANPDAIRPGLPHLRPALQAGAKAVASFEAEKASLARDRLEIDQERQRLTGLRAVIDQARTALRMVLELGPRVRTRIRDRSASPSERREAALMRRDIVQVVPPLRKAAASSTASILDQLRARPAPAPSAAPEKSVEDPDDGPSGP